MEDPFVVVTVHLNLETLNDGSHVRGVLCGIFIIRTRWGVRLLDSKF